MNPFILKLTLFVNFVLHQYFEYGSAYMLNGNPYHRQETLDTKGKYILQWAVDWKMESVMFNVTVETTGFVAFGLSDNGKATEFADMVIGGVYPNGQTYFSDRHVEPGGPVTVKAIKNWVLHEGRENGTHTFLTFSRDFDTCDAQNYQITEDRICLIWWYGEKDGIDSKNQLRGSHDILLLNPDFSPNVEWDAITGNPSANDVTGNGKKFKVWTINPVMEMPANDTTYWCTVYKAPELSRKHHVIGMKARFANKESRMHVHHLFLQKCNPPHGQQEMFSKFQYPRNHKGQTCFDMHQSTGRIPVEYCTELFMGWAVGSRGFFNPPHVGIPFGNNPKEYYVLQVHYDNFDLVAGQTVDFKLDFFYTDYLRPEESGAMSLRHTTPGRTPSLLVPPQSSQHTIFGICGGQCTNKIVSAQQQQQKEIKIYGLNFHSHNSGRRMKLHHFRGEVELRWIASDDNFGFDFQQRHELREERTVLPGDVLVLRCEYDNTWTTGSVVGGYSSHQEMCSAFLFYYNKILDFQVCSSEIESHPFRDNLLPGLGSITWSAGDIEFLVANSGSFMYPYESWKVSQALDKFVNWTQDTRELLQNFQLHQAHNNICPREIYANGVQSNSLEIDIEQPYSLASYPYNAKQYEAPPRKCYSP